MTKPQITKSPNREITRFFLFHNDLPGHIVVSSAANDAAFHFEFTLLRRIKAYCSRLSRRDGLVDAKLLHLKPMLDVLAGDIQNYVFAPLHADHIGFDNEFAHGDRKMNGRSSLLSGAGRQQSHTKNQQTAKLEAANQQR
jgi:hypothetical protein